MQNAAGGASVSQGDLSEATVIREWAEVPGADWQALFAGSADPFAIDHLGLSWRKKDMHFVLYAGDRAACHVSMLLRHLIRVRSERIAVTGVAGVFTRPDLRHRGLARCLLDHALREIQNRTESEFALLFCLPQLGELYRGLGWQGVSSAVHVEQPSGVIEAPLRTMVLPLRSMRWPGGPVWLDSPPW